MHGMDEKELTLNWVHVSDGHWHDIHITRFGGSAIMALDGGGVHRITTVMDFNSTDQLLNYDRSSLVVGGDVHYLGVGATVVDNDFADG